MYSGIGFGVRFVSAGLSHCDSPSGVPCGSACRETALKRGALITSDYGWKSAGATAASTP